MRIFDTHCHIADEAFAEDLEQVIDRFHAACVRRANVIADPCEETPNQARVRAIVDAHDDLIGSIGAHPHNASRYTAAAEKTIRDYLALPNFKCLGEIGLDYHYDLSERSVQRSVFARQLMLADELNAPVQLHIREAHEDAREIISRHLQNGGRLRGIMHCFTGDWETARFYLDAGLYISLSGALTFKNAKHLIEVCRNVPADRLLLETDCPYMAPVPLRGRRNEPAYITHTLACAACVRGVSPEALAERTYQNALSVFEITEEEALGSTNPI